MTIVGTVASIHRFPVKSMQGETLDEVALDADGIAGDRRWALRDAETGKLVSAKRPRLWRAALDCRAVTPEGGTDDDVEVTVPSGDTYGIHDPGLRIALSALFGREVSIERAESAQQGVYESDWPEIDGLTLAGELDLPTNLTGEGTSFVDLGVLHLLTTASLDALRAAAPDVTVDVRRFRPSIVIDTGDATGFVENDWDGTTLSIGDVRIGAQGPAPRCVMTTVAQDGLPREPGVLQALAEHNRLTNPMGTYACLGSYANVAQPGMIRVGDEITSG